MCPLEKITFNGYDFCILSLKKNSPSSPHPTQPTTLRKPIPWGWRKKPKTKCKFQNISLLNHPIPQGFSSFLHKSGYTILWSWMVENFDGGMCNRFWLFDPTADFALQMGLQAVPNNYIPTLLQSLNLILVIQMAWTFNFYDLTSQNCVTTFPCRLSTDYPIEHEVKLQ